MPYKKTGRPHLAKTKAVERMVVNLTLPVTIVERVDAECEQQERSRSQIIEFALRDFLDLPLPQAVRTKAA